MSVQKVWFVLMALPAIIGIHQWAFAQNITVDFINDAGSAACAQKSGPSPLNISGTCGPITLSANAKVSMIDGGSDLIQLNSAVITANSPVNNFHIIFKRQYVQGPSTSAGPPVITVNYKTTANGSFSPATNGNSITATGYVTNVPTDPQQTMGSVSHTVAGGAGAFSKFADKLWPRASQGELSGDRVLRVDMSFKLQTANNTLNLTTGVKLYNGAAGGDPTDEEEVQGKGENGNQENANQGDTKQAN
jgi:hypothetical protein